MSGSASITLPKRPSALDTTRRRGPPSPLNLGAACQRKISRTFEKYPEPNLPGVDQFVTRDSCCDRIVRAKYPSHQRMKSLDLEWLGQRINRRRSASGNSDSISDITDKSQIKNDRSSPPRTFDGIYGNSYIEVNPCQSLPQGNAHSRQSSIDSTSLIGMSESQIAIPPLCLLEQEGDFRGFAQQHVSRLYSSQPTQPSY